MPQGDKLLTSMSNVRNSPKWSMRARPTDKDQRGKSPGPGAYGLPVTEMTKYSRSPKAQFGTSDRESMGKAGSAPGPGQYAPKDAMACTPKYGFGTSLRSGAANRSSTPGPGTYDVRGTMQQTSSTFSARYGEGKRAQTPGPGAYAPKHDVFDMSPKFGFGTAQRPGLSTTSKGPGPGTYQHLSTLGGNVICGNAPKYSMKPRREDGSGMTGKSGGPGPQFGPFTQFG